MAEYTTPVNQFLKSIDLQPYDRYLPNAFNDSLSLLEKVNKIIHGLNESHQLTNEVIEKWNLFVDWVNNGGVNQPIDDKLNSLLTDGTIMDLIQPEIIRETTTQLNEVSTKLDKKVDKISKNGSIIEFFSNGSIVASFDLVATQNTPIIQNYINELVSNGQIEGVALENYSQNVEKTNYIYSIQDKNQLNFKESYYISGDGGSVPHNEFNTYFGLFKKGKYLLKQSELTNGIIYRIASYSKNEWNAQNFIKIIVTGSFKTYILDLPSDVYLAISVSNNNSPHGGVFDLVIQNGVPDETRKIYMPTLEIVKEQLPSDIFNGVLGDNILVVGNGCKYRTINGALSDITDSSESKRYVILLTNGVYEENVKLQDKYVSLGAINKQGASVLDHTGEYKKAPIEMSGRNTVFNLKVLATHNKRLSTYNGEPSYAIHHDYSGVGTSYIKDCVLISHQSAAFGSGSHQGQTIILENSHIEHIGDESFQGGKPAILFHPYVFTATNQKLIMTSCFIKSNAGKVLSLIDSNNNGYPGSTGDNRDTTLSFYNNIFWSTLNGKNNIIYKPTGSLTAGAIDGYMKITGDSFGNNLPELNL